MGFSGTVVEAAEPLVQGHSLNAKIDREVLVVQIVEIVVCLQPCFPLGDEFMESRVAHGRTDTCVHQVKDCVDGMRRDDPVKKHAGKIQQVFDGVHGQARPGADVDVLVMKVV